MILHTEPRVPLGLWLIGTPLMSDHFLFKNNSEILSKFVDGDERILMD